jgi:hypothetical protein
MTHKKSKPVPTSLRAAFEQDKQTGFRERQLSVERHAEIQAVTPAVFYKWMETESMPVNRLAGWFHNTNGKGVIRFLATQARGIFIDLPIGRKAQPSDIHALQGVLNSAIGALLEFHAGQLQREECIAALVAGMEGLSWHRENVSKSDQPELELS